MKKEEINQAIKRGRAGRIVTFRKADEKNGIEKVSFFQGQLGVNYEKMKSTREGRESGKLPAKNAGLPWGQWDEFPNFIALRGQVYLRISNYHKPIREFYKRNGVVISPEEGKRLRKDRESNSSVKNVKIESITQISG